jgi:hypothetical protein
MEPAGSRWQLHFGWYFGFELGFAEKNLHSQEFDSTAQ